MRCLPRPLCTRCGCARPGVKATEPLHAPAAISPSLRRRNALRLSPHTNARACSAAQPYSHAPHPTVALKRLTNPAVFALGAPHPTLHRPLRTGAMPMTHNTLHQAAPAAQWAASARAGCLDACELSVRQRNPPAAAPNIWATQHSVRRLRRLCPIIQRPPHSGAATRLYTIALGAPCCDAGGSVPPAALPAACREARAAACPRCGGCLARGRHWLAWQHLTP